MAANNYPRVFDGQPIGADQWFNPIAEDVTGLTTAQAVGTALDSCEVSTVGIINSGITNVETNIAKLQLGPVAITLGQLYRFDVRAILQNSVTTDQFELRIRRDTAVTGTLVQQLPVYRPGHTAGYLLVGWCNWQADVAGSIPFFISFIQAAGSTGNLTVYGQQQTQARSGAQVGRIGSGGGHRVVP